MMTAKMPMMVETKSETASHLSPTQKPNLRNKKAKAKFPSESKKAKRKGDIFIYPERKFTGVPKIPIIRETNIAVLVWA